MRRLLWATFAIVVLCGTAAAFAYWHFISWADQPLPIADDTIIELRSGDSLSAFAERLQRNGTIERSAYLVWLARLNGLDTQLQAGEYQVANGTTAMGLLHKLTAGDVVSYQFRIAEGETVGQMLATLAKQPNIKHTLEADTAQALAAELSLETPFAEGAFFPDTYQYVAGTTDREIMQASHQAMLTHLQSAWDERKQTSTLANKEQLLILASIVEKESGAEVDRRQISQVFHQRLIQGMRLQTDPTVIYGLGERFDGNLTRAHLREQTPYNTYRIHGLPPTPISLPSQAALEAAARPAEGKYLYFVARGDGTSEFSRTLAEHNAAVRKFQLGGRN